MRAEAVHAKILMKDNHTVLDEGKAAMWSYTAGERYDVVSTVAKELIAAGKAELIDVPPQTVGGEQVPEAMRAALHKAIEACVPGASPSPSPSPEAPVADPPRRRATDVAT